MDDLIHDLIARSESSLIPLELPSEENLLDIEEQLLLPLPKAYRQFLLEASHLVIGSMELSTAADPLAHTYLAEVTALAWDSGLPRHLMPICTTNNKQYCITAEANIQIWKHEEQDESQEWEDIWDWAEKAWF